MLKKWSNSDQALFKTNQSLSAWTVSVAVAIGVTVVDVAVADFVSQVLGPHSNSFPFRNMQQI